MDEIPWQIRPCAEYMFYSFCAFDLSLRSLGLLVRESIVLECLLLYAA